MKYLYSLFEHFTFFLLKYFFLLLFVFGNMQITVLNGVGCVITMVGIAYYNHVKTLEKQLFLQLDKTSSADQVGVIETAVIDSSLAPATPRKGAVQHEK